MTGNSHKDDQNRQNPNHAAIQDFYLNRLAMKINPASESEIADLKRIVKPLAEKITKDIMSKMFR